ncbi:MAG TPA: hypothetical protein IAC12_08935 [Candidatus Aphodovivens avistercoris]|nr:hypothetical protein [Candidatus Aphodovivens avistercoris]
MSEHRERPDDGVANADGHEMVEADVPPEVVPRENGDFRRFHSADKTLFFHAYLGPFWKKTVSLLAAIGNPHWEVLGMSDDSERSV